MDRDLVDSRARRPRELSVGGKRFAYPEPRDQHVSSQMRGNRGVDTQPERTVRSLLHRRGLRFRKDYPIVVDGVRVKTDIAFTRVALAVFIDGCFWHSCALHGRQPRTNGAYWAAKLARNVERDQRNSSLLACAGWSVRRYWEHEPADAVAADIAAAYAFLCAGMSRPAKPN